MLEGNKHDSVGLQMAMSAVTFTFSDSSATDNLVTCATLYSLNDCISCGALNKMYPTVQGF